MAYTLPRDRQRHRRHVRRMRQYRAMGDLPGIFPGPGYPGGGFTPGPYAPADLQPSPTVPYSIYPTTLRRGEPVTITGNFGGVTPFQVAVGFTNGGTQSPTIYSPNYGTVVVPDDAETGECYIEVNGSRAFGTQCVIEDSHPARVQPRWREEWSDPARGGSELIYTSGLGQEPPCLCNNRNIPAALLALGLGGYSAMRLKKDASWTWIGLLGIASYLATKNLAL